MPETEPQLSKHDTFLSPVEERHIDYILEEEFSVNPDFLKFFIEEAKSTAPDKSRIVECVNYDSCKAVRSATTEDGETDVLVRYAKQDGELPIAILIEDKIRAGFQPEQAKRYRKRGEDGKGKGWSDYWTCLVSHSKYFVDSGDFDAVISLQAIQKYFAKDETSKHSGFRAHLLKKTILKYETTGIQKIDSGMTRFRRAYAFEFDKSLKSGEWEREKTRDAWWDDTFFLFRRTAWPKGVQVRHQARTGRMDLILPTRDEAPLRDLIEKRVAWHPDFLVPRIEVVSVGKMKSAFQISVPKITDFSEHAPTPPFEDFFAAIEFLANFYDRCSDLLPEALRISTTRENPQSESDPPMRALRAMLLGLMRSTVTRHGTEMPYPLPDLRRLTTETPEAQRYFASPGLMGGFHLELHQVDKQSPFILSECSSRQWGTHSERHKISISEILQLNDGA